MREGSGLIEKAFNFRPCGVYVYVHRKKTNGCIFYVGKATGTRGWQTTGRNSIWHRIAEKHGVISEIVLDNMDEGSAFTLEKDLIAYYGKLCDQTGILSNITDGGEGLLGNKPSESSILKQKASFKMSQKAKDYADSMKTKIVMDERICFYSVRDCANYVASIHEKGTAQVTHISKVAHVKAYSYLGHTFRWDSTPLEDYHAARKSLRSEKKKNLVEKNMVARHISQRRKVRTHTGETFDSVKSASEWVVAQGKAKNPPECKGNHKPCPCR